MRPLNAFRFVVLSSKIVAMVVDDDGGAAADAGAPSLASASVFAPCAGANVMVTAPSPGAPRSISRAASSRAAETMRGSWNAAVSPELLLRKTPRAS